MNNAAALSSGCVSAAVSASVPGGQLPRASAATRLRALRKACGLRRSHNRLTRKEDTMSEPSLMFTFNTYAEAQRARQALDAGEAGEIIEAQIRVADDESGPMKSNFVIGNKNHDGKQTGDYDEQYRSPPLEGPVFVLVRCREGAAEQRVRARMLEAGGRER